jgi:hypothetical protein
MRASVLASFSTSALLAVCVSAGGGPTNLAQVETTELEAQLARKPHIYLVIDPPARRLEIRARGVILDTIRLSGGVEVVRQHPLLHEGRPETLHAPTLLTITHGPGDAAREIIAPQSLVPYSEDAEAAEPVVDTSGVSATPTPVPDPPLSYRAELDNGWDLWVCESLPSEGLLARFRDAVRDGLKRLLGKGSEERTALAIAVSRADAQRIFHLLTTDRAILVTTASE